MKQPTAIIEWIVCVEKAKKRLGIPVGSFVPIRGELLRLAREIYCASPGY